MCNEHGHIIKAIFATQIIAKKRRITAGAWFSWLKRRHIISAVSLHNFFLGYEFVKKMSRLISQKNSWQIILWYFLRSFHNFRCGEVVACGGVAVFIQESAKHVKYFHN